MWVYILTQDHQLLARHRESLCRKWRKGEERLGLDWKAKEVTSEGEGWIYRRGSCSSAFVLASTSQTMDLLGPDHARMLGQTTCNVKSKFWVQRHSPGFFALAKNMCENWLRHLCKGVGRAPLCWPSFSAPRVFTLGLARRPRKLHHRSCEG